MPQKSSLKSMLSEQMLQKLEALEIKHSIGTFVPDAADLTAALMSTEGDNEGLSIDEGREMLKRANKHKFRLAPSLEE